MLAGGFSSQVSLVDDVVVVFDRARLKPDTSALFPSHGVPYETAGNFDYVQLQNRENRGLIPC